LPLVALTVVGASTRATGLLVAASTATTIVVTPLTGPWLDSHPVLPVIITTNVLRGLILAAVPATFFWSVVSMPLLYAVALAVGALTAVFDIAILTYVPRLVRADQLLEANSRVNTSISVAETAGPAIAGGLIRLLSAPLAIIADVLSYAVSTVFLTSIRTGERVPAGAPAGGPFAQRASWGIRHCFADPRLRLLLVASTWFNLCEQTTMTAFLVYAIRVLSLSAAVLGALLTAAGCGAVVGSLAAAAAGLRLGTAKVLSCGAGIAAASLAAAPVPTGEAAPFVLGPALFLYGFGVGLFNVHAVAFRQAVTPADSQGRVNAGYRMLTFGAVPAGAVAAGFAGELIGTRSTIACAVVALLAGMSLFAVLASRRLPGRSIPAPT